MNVDRKTTKKILTGFLIVAAIAAATGIVGIILLQLSVAVFVVEWILGAAAGLAVVAAVLQGIRISRSVEHTICKMADAAFNLAHGNDIGEMDGGDSAAGSLAASLHMVANNMRGHAQNVQLLASGELDIGVNILSEKDVLGKSLQKMAETISRLIEEINQMSRAHELGDIDARIPDIFEGAYRTMAEGINSMVEGHINVKKKAMACIAEFGLGNFDAELELFPGKKAFINETVEQLRGRLRLLQKDINDMVETALEGDLAKRADASRHEGDFKNIMEGINSLMNAIIQPIREAAHVLSRMSSGNLQEYVMGDYKGHHAQMKNAVNSTLDKFNEILGEISRAAVQVAEGTRQVSEGSQAMAQGATEQASSIEELSSSIAMVAGQTEHNALGAKKANELSMVAKQSAARGDSQMREMLASMEEINEASGNISKIIKVIDDIAFQTNILSLNAAVEAARAGVHGKGFAVVAEEVRSLAARSAQAAKETADLIEGSVKKVEQGTRLAEDTAGALTEIVDNVEQAASLVSEIAAASNEQAVSIGQINSGIEQVSNVVQNNSATAQESAAASQELSGQAEILKSLAGQFKLRDA